MVDEIRTRKMSAGIVPHPDFAFIGRFEDAKIDSLNWSPFY